MESNLTSIESKLIGYEKLSSTNVSTVAVAEAAAGGGENVTVGAEVYPEPG